MSDDRRRHGRSAPRVRARGELGGVAFEARAVLDVSVGGALLELPPDGPLPALGARGVVHLEHGQGRLTRGARVVRVRFTGRERGARLPPALALVFDDGDATAAARLAALLQPSD